MIIAEAVMITARRRVVAASMDAIIGDMPAERLSLANVTTSTELAVATPRLIIAPISAGTLKVVWVRWRPQSTPAAAPGRAMTIMKGSSQL
jgi:hypothetical protein